LDGTPLEFQQIEEVIELKQHAETSRLLLVAILGGSLHLLSKVFIQSLWSPLSRQCRLGEPFCRLHESLRALRQPLDDRGQFGLVLGFPWLGFGWRFLCYGCLLV
jgi:hypothetical protein